VFSIVDVGLFDVALFARDGVAERAEAVLRAEV